MKDKKTIRVKCTFVITIEVPKSNYDEYFDIEENHCPGTGFVGIAIDKHIEKSDKENVCWACALDGECEIVD